MKLFTKILLCVYLILYAAGIVLGVVSMATENPLLAAVGFLLSLVMSFVIYSTAKSERYRMLMESSDIEVVRLTKQNAMFNKIAALAMLKMKLYNDKFVLEKAKVDFCKRKISSKEFLEKMKAMESVIESDIHYVKDAQKKLEEM